MKEIKFMNYRKQFGLLSALLVTGSLIVVFTIGVKRNVDFEGGTKLNVVFSSPDIDVAALRAEVSKVDDKTTIVTVKTDFGSSFSLKVKNPEVEKGKEAEASLARRSGFEAAFEKLTDEDRELLDLMRGKDAAVIAEKMILENPLKLSDVEAAVRQRYTAIAEDVKRVLNDADTLEALAQASNFPDKTALVQALHVTYPTLNQISVGLLNVSLTRNNPLNRASDQDYQDIADHVAKLRDDNNDFLPSFELLDFSGQVREGEDAAKLSAFFKDNFALGSYKIVSSETFSPSIAAELLSKAWQAVLLALFGILIYVSLRFRLGYAVAAVVALTHDVIIALGFFALSDAELSNPVVAAFLTIVGYSLNDTIVVFDRIRDNLGSVRRPDMGSLMNVSINQTLSRTLVTSLTTFFVVGVIFWFSNNATLEDFAFPLLIGIVVGTYSSIFVASPVLLLWHKKVRPVNT